jgi:myo-inositol-1(or 4)-monophosphatase
MSAYLSELRVAESLARSAGRRMRRQRRGGFDVQMKGHNDPVTDIDVRTEEFLTAELSEAFPDDGIIGEELEETAETSGRRWFIDPIDGTLNFSRGIPMYCVSIALQEGDDSVVGVIYDPNRDELFSARKNGGAYLNGEPMAVSDVDALEESLLVTGFPRSLENVEVDNLMNFAELTRASRGVRRLGSAALDLAYVAAGRLDGFWEYYLSPWDCAAGYLMVAEAGGNVTTVEGDRYTAHEESVLATNGRIHRDIIERLANI